MFSAHCALQCTTRWKELPCLPLLASLAPPVKHHDTPPSTSSHQPQNHHHHHWWWCRWFLVVHHEYCHHITTIIIIIHITDITGFKQLYLVFDDTPRSTSDHQPKTIMMITTISFWAFSATAVLKPSVSLPFVTIVWHFYNFISFSPDQHQTRRFGSFGLFFLSRFKFSLRGKYEN